MDEKRKGEAGKRGGDVEGRETRNERNGTGGDKYESSR